MILVIDIKSLYTKAYRLASAEASGLTLRHLYLTDKLELWADLGDKDIMIHYLPQKDGYGRPKYTFSMNLVKNRVNESISYLYDDRDFPPTDQVFDCKEFQRQLYQELMAVE